MVQLGTTHVAVQATDPLDGVLRSATGDALVREAGRVIAVRQHDAPGGDERLDLALDVIHPVGGEEQRHGRPPWRETAGDDDAPREHLPHEGADWTVARLARHADGH